MRHCCVKFEQFIGAAGGQRRIDLEVDCCVIAKSTTRTEVGHVEVRRAFGSKSQCMASSARTFRV